jgi:hypothetical protein
MVPFNVHAAKVLRAEGHTLPQELVRMRDGLAALDAAARAERFPVDTESQIRDAIRRQLMDAALDGSLAAKVKGGQPVPLNLSALIRHRESLALAEERRGIIDSAASSLVSQTQGMLRDRHHRIISEHLAPALGETMAEARQLVKALGGREPTKAALFDAPAAVRDAFANLGTVAERYVAVRGAFQALSTFVNGAQRDRRRLLLGEFTPQSLALAWPEWNDIRRNFDGSTVVPTPPWPDDPVGRLAWIVRSGVEVWVPTPQQLDEAIAELDERTSETVSEVAGRGG